jgi:hypothetical protein
VVGDSTTQVVSGLAEGDKVIVTSTSVQATGAATGQQRTGIGGAGGFGGGGGGAGATRRFGGGGGGGGFGGPPGGP